VVGGTFAVIKLYVHRIDDMIVRNPAAMKIAFGENPKRVYNGQNKSPKTRMATAAVLRELLFKAKRYMEDKDAAAADPSVKAPAFDMKLEAMLPVMRHEIPLKAHAHRADDIFTSIRIAREFGLDITLDHCTEGHLVVEDLAKENLPIFVGPSLGGKSKYELQNKTFETPGILAKAGLQVSIITDAPVIPQQYLPLCAGLAVKAGMDPFDALKAITINPAKHLGVDKRVGSLEAGKDGDVVVCDGDPMVSDSCVKAVFINGERAV
jgi:imidazolonepropionase-like amidohydrolase